MKHSAAIKISTFLVNLGLIISYLRFILYLIFLLFLILKPSNLPSILSGTNIEAVYLNIKDFPFYILFFNLLGIFTRIGLTISFLKNCQKLLNNLTQNQIFIQPNVTLAKNSSLALGIMSVLPDFGWRKLILIIRAEAIVAAILIWIFALVLEKAKNIAEENAFTI